MPASVNDAPTSPAGNAEQQLLAALARRYADAEFTARSAAADLAPALWQAAGVARADAGSCGRGLRSRRSATLVGRPDRTGVVRWRLRGRCGARGSPAGARRSTHHCWSGGAPGAVGGGAGRRGRADGQEGAAAAVGAPRPRPDRRPIPDRRDASPAPPRHPCGIPFGRRLGQSSSVPLVNRRPS
jgi:hypothetical protein